MQVFTVLAIYPDEDRNTKVDLLEVFEDGTKAQDFVKTLSTNGIRPGSAWARKYFVVERLLRQ
jgi:hypothetical protein